MPLAASPANPAWVERLPRARVWRWRLAASEPLRVEQSVDVAHVVWAALNETARAMFGSNVLPPDLHSSEIRVRRDGPEAHDHAFVTPEDLDLDGYLDTISVTQAACLGGRGFTRKGLALLGACPGFWLGRADVKLEPESLSEACPLGFGGPSRVWQSMTPFAPPLHRRPAARQITDSLESMGLPAPVFVEPLAQAIVTPDRGEVRAWDFAPLGPASRRWTGALEVNVKHMAFWRLTFDSPVEGPILIGGLNHFGLGRFAPAEG
jgi:CRISPR-associated protein Csb2